MFNLLCLISLTRPQRVRSSTLQTTCHYRIMHFCGTRPFSLARNESLDRSKWSWPSSWTLGSVAQMADCMHEQQAELKRSSYTGAALRFIVFSKTRTLYCPLSICSATAAVSLYLLGQRVWQNEKIMTIIHPWHLCLIRKVFLTSSFLRGGLLGSGRSFDRSPAKRCYEYWTGRWFCYFAWSYKSLMQMWLMQYFICNIFITTP